MLFGGDNAGSSCNLSWNCLEACGFVDAIEKVSGAGYPGISSIDIIDNVVPFISGEEDKIEVEAQKILGVLNKSLSGFVDHDLKVSASCNR